MSKMFEQAETLKIEIKKGLDCHSTLEKAG
jgi:hypothetical protein